MPERAKLTAALLVGLCSTAFAVAGLSDPGLYIEATNAQGTGSVSIPAAAFDYDPFFSEYSYLSFGAVEIKDGLTTIGTILNIQVFIIDDPSWGPEIYMNFGVEAGESDTEFSIAPGIVSTFIPDQYSEAKMSYGFILTESDGDGDPNARLTSTHPTAGIYRTWYNGVEFYDSVREVAATGQGAQGQASADRPPSGFEDIPATVTDFNVAYGFELSANDRFNTTSSYLFEIPEPTSLMLLSAGVVLLTARRR